VRFPVAETTARVYFKVWEMGCFGGFLVGREVAKCRGTIIFTGAPPPACAGARALPRLPAPSTHCARWGSARAAMH
jgi:hypothetical protein